MDGTICLLHYGLWTSTVYVKDMFVLINSDTEVQLGK